MKIEQRLKSFTGNYSIAIETAGQSIALDADQKMRAASVIKLPILLEGYRQLDHEEIDNSSITWNDDALVGGSGVLAHLTSVRRLPIEDILTLMTIVSDNTASNIAINQLGMEKINKFCLRLGCENTVLERQFMDFAAAEKGFDNFTTASDMVRLLKESDRGTLLSDRSKKQVKDTLKSQQFTANLHGRIDEGSEVAVASKSGNLPGVVNDVGIFEYEGRTVYVAVLLGNLPDTYTGQELIADIGWFIYEYLTK